MLTVHCPATSMARLLVFNDFHLHGASAPEWEQCYSQLSAGNMRSTLVGTATAGLHIFRKWMSARVAQQGCLPAGQRCFALLGATGAGQPWMQGRLLDTGAVLQLRAGEQFLLQRPAGMELLACSFGAEDFRLLLYERPWSPGAMALLGRPSVQAPSSNIVQLIAVLRGKPSPASVFAELTNLFEAAAHPALRVGDASAAYLVAECHRRMLATPHAPLRVDQLCDQLRVSRRSLQNAFRQVADTTPVDYLRSLRLNYARRRLTSMDKDLMSISQAATDAGFEHMGHFATRYRRLFAERPSQTQRTGVLPA